MLFLWGAVWAEPLYSPATALRQGLCNQCDLQSEKSIIVRFGTVYQMILLTVYIYLYMYYIVGFVPFPPIPPFFEISCLEEVWEVNEFKYISHPLVFFVIILFIQLLRTRELEVK